ncbi:hypothetical protein BLA29_000026 [Euroglyphus maynei]|uniref:Uncharacterized protein n=1 Tax=Euroglyphus maynei TaxID=6958 RepID=A0A1Y3BAP9_EURMA|nr:hypothetical protein BLA29_000026 [Euroglyphus maynei]
MKVTLGVRQFLNKLYMTLSGYMKQSFWLCFNSEKKMGSYKKKKNVIVMLRLKHLKKNFQPIFA